MLVTNFLDVSGMSDVSVLHRISTTQVRFISFCKSVTGSSFCVSISDPEINDCVVRIIARCDIVENSGFMESGVFAFVYCANANALTPNKKMLL